MRPLVRCGHIENLRWCLLGKWCLEPRREPSFDCRSVPRLLDEFQRGFL